MGSVSVGYSGDVLLTTMFLPPSDVPEGANSGRVCQQQGCPACGSGASSISPCLKRSSCSLRAEQTLREVLLDEPDWAEILLVAPIEIGDKINLN